MNSLEDIDCIYILNLDKYKYKYDILKKKLDSFNLKLNIKRISGIDGNLYKEEFHLNHKKFVEGMGRIKRKYYFKSCGKIINPELELGKQLYRSYGAYGCLKSNIKIINDAIENNYNNILILQDDIYFHKNFVELANLNLKKYKNYDGIYFGCSISNNIVSKRIGGLFGLVLNKRPLKMIKDKMEKFNLPDDFCVSEVLDTFYKKTTVILEEKIIIASVEESTTQNSNFIFYENYYKKMNINLNNYDLSYNYKKERCLVILCGLIKKPRILRKMIANFNENIINNNNIIIFDFILSSSASYYKTPKSGGKFIKNIKEIIPNVKKIYIHSLEPEILCNWYKRCFYRLKEIFIEDKYLNYDKIIYIRPDVVLNNKINLNDYNNGFGIITGIKVRDDIFHNRDWDYCWIGDSKCFKLWLYLHIYKIFNIKINDIEVINILNYEIEERDDYMKLKSEIGLLESDNKNLLSHHVINEIICKKYKFSISDKKKIFGTILRN